MRQRRLKGRVGKKLGLIVFIWEREIFYRADYRADKNRDVPRAGIVG
jgi:hypothetical protein